MEPIVADNKALTDNEPLAGNNPTDSKPLTDKNPKEEFWLVTSVSLDKSHTHAYRCPTEERANKAASWMRQKGYTVTVKRDTYG